MAKFENVRTSNDHFRNERKAAYSAEGPATIREHITNAADAVFASGRTNSGRIDVSYELLGENVSRLVIADNGVGMDENTIRDVFMVLGKTTKTTGAGITGGGGRARILTHFSQHKYHIYTRDLHVIGKGDRFKIIKRPDPKDYVDGCVMEVYVENINRYGHSINWGREISDFLDDCQSPYTITVNGVPFKNWLYKGRKLRDIAAGTLHINKSKSSDYVIVRVNGIIMFREYVGDLSGRVVIELTPETSRQYMTSNRDAFNDHFKTEFSKWLGELKRDEKGALEDQANRITVVEGSGGFKHYGEDNSLVFIEDNSGDQGINGEHSHFPEGTVVGAELNPMAVLLPQDDNSRPDSFAVPSVVNNNSASKAISQLPEENITFGELRTVDTSAVREDGAVLAPAEQAARIVQQKKFETLRNKLFTIIVNDNTACLDDDSQKRAVRAQVASYNPSNWKIKFNKKDERVIVGGNKAKVLLLWKSICHLVVEEYVAMKKIDCLNWGVGWLFGPDQAERREHANRNWFLLNPLNNLSALRWKLTNAETLYNMLVLAIHQIAHVDSDYHDGSFVRTSEKLTARMLPRLGEVRKVARKVSKLKLA